MKILSKFINENKLENIYNNIDKGTILYVVYDTDKYYDKFSKENKKHKCSQIKIKSVENRGVEDLFGKGKINTTCVYLESNPYKINHFLIFDKPNEKNKEFKIQRIHGDGSNWYFAGISEDNVISAIKSKYSEQIREIDEEISKLMENINSLNEQKENLTKKLVVELEK